MEIGTRRRGGRRRGLGSGRRIGSERGRRGVKGRGRGERKEKEQYNSASESWRIRITSTHFQFVVSTHSCVLKSIHHLGQSVGASVDMIGVQDNVDHHM